MLSGYTDRLPDDVLLDTGVLYINNTIWGATRGGIRWNPGKEERNIPYDGQKAKRVGLDRTTFFDSNFSGRFIHFGPEDIARAEPGSSTAGSDPASLVVTPQPAGELLAVGDYLTNVRLVFERGQGGFCQIRFPYAKVGQYEMSGNDRGEAEIQLTIEARAAEGATDGPAPYVIEMLTAIS